MISRPHLLHHEGTIQCWQPACMPVHDWIACRSDLSIAAFVARRLGVFFDSFDNTLSSSVPGGDAQQWLVHT